MMNIAPTPKMNAVGIGGAVAIILVWGLSIAGIEMPAAVASAVATVISFALGWMTPERG
jgi:hypothetical protein